MLLTAALIASVQSGWGQTISGCVSDTEGNPVIGARVTFENSEGDRFIAISGEDGSYTIHFGFPPTVVSSTGGFSSAFNLQQNYPNPFNSTTSIDFSLTVATTVRLVVYDILGQPVRTLVDDHLTPGIHGATWDGVNAAGVAVAAGVYLYRLSTPAAVASGKMLLLDGATILSTSVFRALAPRPVARRVQSEIFRVLVSGIQVETLTLKSVQIPENQFLKIGDVVRRRFSTENEDTDGDGSTDLVVVLDVDARSLVGVQDLDLDGTADLLFSVQEKPSAAGALLTAFNYLIEFGDSTRVWHMVTVETAGERPVALYLRQPLNARALDGLSMNDATQFAERQAMAHIPEVSQVGRGQLRLKIPQSFNNAESSFFGWQPSSNAKSFDWSHCGSNKCNEYLFVSGMPIEPQPRPQFGWSIVSSYPLATTDLRLTAISADDEEIQLTPLLEPPNLQRVNGSETWKSLVRVGGELPGIGFYRLGLWVQTGSDRWLEFPGWHLKTQDSPLQLDLIGGTRHQMVHVPAGPFLMGSDRDFTNERPQHRVELDGFYLDQTEVTNGQWNAYAAVLGTELRSESDEHPATQVSWEEADEYCRWAGLRLPSEAEWEKGARGTDGRTYPWGETISGTHANYVDSGDAFDNNTTPVGAFPESQSPYGALDMAGNVWEWAGDWFDESYYDSSPPKNPTGPSNGSDRVLRGGSWLNQPLSLRTSHRGGRHPEDRTNFIGFRCARDE